ncbi:MAG: endonuclease/exonuclease/phosphatase family protein [Deltaproteobacteria bacterium]|nr:endonuclease/exonuclease/phosphatase family protein [Deltaproteobacteria bacterium]
MTTDFLRCTGRALVRMAVALTTVGTLVAAPGCGGADQPGDVQPVSVMTRNLYLGADLSAVFFAGSMDDLTRLSGEVWRDITDSRFRERAVALAAEIAEANPDIVALQEVSLFRSQTPSDWNGAATPNATDIEMDFLEVLLAELGAQGARYQFADGGVFTDQELPARAADGTSFDIRLADRNVTLVREGLTFASGPTAAFEAAFAFPVAGLTTLTLQRGYVTTDVTVGTKSVRVVNSHLEVGGPLGRTQEKQAEDLMIALAPHRGPILLAGDFNSPADMSGTKTYATLTTTTAASSGFRDAWLFRNRNSDSMQIGQVTGGTCCVQLTDTVLAPRERIDLILLRGAIQANDARVVQPMKTPSGLWPSDHLGVFAQFQIQ